jgi:hypothetical protein
MHSCPRTWRGNAPLTLCPVSTPSGQDYLRRIVTHRLPADSHSLAHADDLPIVQLAKVHTSASEKLASRDLSTVIDVAQSRMLAGVLGAMAYVSDGEHTDQTCMICPYARRADSDDPTRHIAVTWNHSWPPRHNMPEGMRSIPSGGSCCLALTSPSGKPNTLKR